jgi:hypothetical protein
VAQKQRAFNRRNKNYFFFAAFLAGAFFAGAFFAGFFVAMNSPLSLWYFSTYA